MLTQEIEEKLAELSEYRPEMFMSEEVVENEEAETSE